MMYGYYGDYVPFHIFGSIFMVLFWIVLLVLLFRLFGRDRGHWRGPHDGHRSGTHAVDILKERYAKGEIAKDQYESMKRDIE